MLQPVSGTRGARARTFLLVLAAVLALVVGGAGRAAAAVIPNGAGSGFLDPHTTSTSVNEFQRVQLTSTFHVPDTAVAGDQIVLTLPDALLATSFQAFDLLTPAGKVLGRATLGTDAAGKPALVVTFTALVEGADARGTSGSLTFGLRLDRSKLDFGSGTTDTIDVFGNPVTVTHVTGRENTRKTGSWVPDQTRATATNADGQLIVTSNQMTWRIAVKPGDWTTSTISETAQVGYITDCTSAKKGAKGGFLLEKADPAGGFVVVDPATILEVTACNPTTGAFTVTLTKSADDLSYYRVSYSASLTTDDLGRPVYVDENGNTVVGFPPSYTNSASVTVGTETPVSVEASLVSRNGSGVGGNANAPLVDIEKYSAATPWSGVIFDAQKRPSLTPGPAFEPTNQPAEDYDAAPGKKLAVGASQLVRFTVTNIGSERLRNIVVSDSTTSGPALTGISCDFTAFGGPSTGASGGAAVLPRGASFRCTGTLPGMPAGSTHADAATVTAVGNLSGTRVSDTDTWHAFTPPKVAAVSATSETAPPAQPASALPTLPDTGPADALLPLTLTGFGAVLLGSGLLVGSGRSRRRP